jgi:hypothetical protein
VRAGEATRSVVCARVDGDEGVAKVVGEEEGAPAAFEREARRAGEDVIFGSREWRTLKK